MIKCLKVFVAFFLCMAKIATQDKKKGKDKDDKKDTGRFDLMLCSFIPSLKLTEHSP